MGLVAAPKLRGENMAVVGVHITKISAEKKTVNAVSKVGINNNISVKAVEEKDFSLGSAKQKGLRFTFEFSCKYSPDLGHIDLEGNVLFLSDEARTKQIKKEWDEKKQLGSEIMETVLNAALSRCNIEALKLSQDLNLPVPIPLPKLQKRQAKAAVKAK